MEAKVLAGRYRLHEVLGRGGMATVYRAEDLQTGQTVAVKVLEPEFRRALNAERFFREIQLMRELTHPHILRLLDAGESDNHLYYTVPFIRGGSLREKLNSQSQLPMDEVFKIAVHLASALDYAHANGILHRDIKPENVLLESGSVLLADFGVAKAKDVANETLTATGVSIGTPAYMSPEQASGEKQLDARSDVYSLACVVFEMVAGESPFPGASTQAVIAKRMVLEAPSVRVLRPAASMEVEGALKRALNRVPADRFESAGEFASALTAKRSGRDSHAISVFSPSGRARAVGMGVAVVALVTLAVRYSERLNTNGRPAEERAARSASRDSLANEYVRRGEAQLARRSAIAVTRSLDLYRQAIARDSDFAPAWAGLARTIQFAQAWGYNIPGMSRDSMMRMMVEATERAIEKDSMLASAWVARASMLRLVQPGANRPALMAAKRAVALDSSSAEAWFILGGSWMDSLEFRQSNEAFHRSVQINPGFVNGLTFIGYNYLWAHKFDSAFIWVDSAARIDPSHIAPHQQLVQIRMERREWAEAESECEAVIRLGHGSDQTIAWSALAILAFNRGHHAASDSLLRNARAAVDTLHPTQHDAVYFAYGLSRTGKQRRAIDLLARFSPRTSKHYQLHLKFDPGLDSIRSDPAFSALLAK